MSTVEMNACIRRSLREAWNQGKPDIFDEVNAPTSLDHASVPAQARGIGACSCHLGGCGPDKRNMQLI